MIFKSSPHITHLANPIDGFATEITPPRRVRQNASNWKLIHGSFSVCDCDWKFATWPRKKRKRERASSLIEQSDQLADEKKKK